MPRFAYALPCEPSLVPEWRAAAQHLMGQGAKDHRALLLDRGIFRERVWTQTGEGTPTVSLFLWDCDDVDVATKPPTPDSSEHERWLFDTAIGTFHGQDVATFCFPEPEVLSGTTTMATAAAGTQTMFALPVPPAGTTAVRKLIERVEQGDLTESHSAFLTDASIREEWIWLQQARADLPAMLLIHWIGDDLAGAWDRLTHTGDDAYARVLRDALFTLVVGLAPDVVAGWDIDQVLAMHVRRSDSGEPHTRYLAARVASGVTRRRWDVLERLCTPRVSLADRQVATPRQAVDVLAAAIPDGVPTVLDTLVSDRQILVIVEGATADGDVGLLLGVRDGLIASVRVVPDWPPG